LFHTLSHRIYKELVIGGSKDKIVTGKASEEIAKKLGCELYMYEEAGDFNRKVYDFLRK